MLKTSPPAQQRHVDAHHHESHSSREALRLALGSILTPKRAPLSRSSSGTASPAHPHHWPTSSASGFTSPTHSHTSPATPGNETPPAIPDGHRHHSHPYVPSRLGRSESSEHADAQGSFRASSSHDSLNSSPISRTESMASADEPVRPQSAPNPEVVTVAPGVVKPKARFIQTLQGKSAWDALIHGSFS